MNVFLSFEQTTRDAVRHSSFDKIYVREKTPEQPAGVFSVLVCISYTEVVYIITLSGTHTKKEPVWQKDSDKVSFSGVCSFLYILDLSTLSQ